jgi:hypothetical protein
MSAVTTPVRSSSESRVYAATAARDGYLKRARIADQKREEALAAWGEEIRETHALEQLVGPVCQLCNAPATVHDEMVIGALCNVAQATAALAEEISRRTPFRQLLALAIRLQR